MPYASKAQQRFMHSQHPGVAKQWDNETKKAGGFDNMPDKSSNSSPDVTRMKALERRVKTISAPGQQSQKPGGRHGPIQHKPWQNPGPQTVNNVVQREQVKRTLSKAKEANLSQRQAVKQQKQGMRNQAIANQLSSKK